jgi:leucyl aminopeptidase
MTTIKISDGIVKDDILVVGLSIKTAKGALQIESGDLALETKTLLATLNDLGATGKSDEVILLPGTNTRLIAFTGLGKAEAKYDGEADDDGEEEEDAAPARPPRPPLLPRTGPGGCRR